MKEITGIIKNYEWGNTYFIDKLKRERSDGKKKAEIWFSTNKMGESKTIDGEKLSSYLNRELDFLLKILAIDEPLSLQVHPDKTWAIWGYDKEKDIIDTNLKSFKDENEKTELIFALTNITALNGFKSLDKIIDSFKTYMPVNHYLVLKDNIRDTFQAVFNLNEDEKKLILDEIKETHKMIKMPRIDGFLNIQEVLGRVLSLHEGDISILVVLMLNLVHLPVNSSMFLRAGQIHAYLYGNGVEIMSSSDNVLRAGLTKKHMDVQTLLKITNFDDNRVEIPIMNQEGEILADTDLFKIRYLKKGEYKLNVDKDYIFLLTKGKARVNDLKLKSLSALVIKKEDKEVVIKVSEEAFLTC